MSQRDPLNLRSLPERPVPEEIWTSIDQRLHRKQRGPSPAWAVAAVLVIACAVGLWWGADLSRDAESAALDRYRSASIQLENRVERLQQGVIEFDTLMRAGQVEQRLTALDRQLLKAPEDVVLWRERLTLLDELARLYAGHSAVAQVTAASENQES